MTPLNILVTGACGVTPRAIVRSLRASSVLSGATLVGADRGGNWYGFYEGLYDRVYRVSVPNEPGYAELITEICRNEAIDLLLGSGDAAAIDRAIVEGYTKHPPGEFDVIARRAVEDSIREEPW